MFYSNINTFTVVVKGAFEECHQSECRMICNFCYWLLLLLAIDYVNKLLACEVVSLCLVVFACLSYMLLLSSDERSLVTVVIALQQFIVSYGAESVKWWVLHLLKLMVPGNMEMSQFISKTSRTSYIASGKLFSYSFSKL